MFLFTWRVLVFFWVNPAKSFNQPNLFYQGRLFLSIVGSGKPGETGRGGGAKKLENSARFLFEVSCSHRRNNPTLQKWLPTNRTWPLHDIAMTNIVWCMAYTTGVGGGGPMLRNSRAIGVQ